MQCVDTMMYVQRCIKQKCAADRAAPFSVFISFTIIIVQTLVAGITRQCLFLWHSFSARHAG